MPETIMLLTVSHILLFRQIFQHILKPSTVLTDRLLAGIAGYLLLGLFWGLQMGWALIETPDAVFNQITHTVGAKQDLMYMSFVTLTTLGYGDMTPVSWLAKSISIFTSLSGVLYIAIFISAIIGSANFSRNS